MHKLRKNALNSLLFLVWLGIGLSVTTPFSGYLDIALGARDGSTSVFVADAHVPLFLILPPGDNIDGLQLRKL